MRRILLFITLSFGLSIGYAQIYNNDCFAGDNTPPKQSNPEATIGDSTSMVAAVPVDPNELKGPEGIDSIRWVSINDVLNYTVLFENDPEFATAHAQIVDIRANLPHAKLLEKFALGTYTFANRSFEMPNEPNFYSMRLDCRDSLMIYVDVLAGLDVEKNQVFWHFSSIDPESGYAPWQVDRGMLPVNDSTHVGEGFVTFRIKPHEGMETGDTIGFNARILFDYNDTIPTNYWCNTIDAGAPTSTVKAVVDKKDYSHYHLSFEAEDDKGGCGVKQIRLYLADNLGTYNEYAVCHVDSVLDFTIESGKQYQFMTIAEDRVGNREAAKSSPDLILNFNEPPTDILLSDTIFQDDIALDGFIGELTTIDADNKSDFTYALAEGEGAIHNDMFAIVGNRLQANDCFKCSDIAHYSICISTTDDGGLSYSKTFHLVLRRVLEEPKPQELDVEICEGDTYMFYGEEYAETGRFVIHKSNDYMCDSIYILNVHVKSIPEIPTITVSDRSTLVSSAEYGNQWYKDGVPIDGATEKYYTAHETGFYCVTASNGKCASEPSEEYFVNLDTMNEIEINLQRGWNWISSNIDEANTPNEFFASVMDNLETVRSASGELHASQGSTFGDITTITPATYKVKMTDSATLMLNAEPCNVDDFKYNLSIGWNWIPYIPIVELDIATALDNFQPYQNDVIKGHTSFATYSNGQWIGTLKTLHPNSGYMYYTSQQNVLKYAIQRAQRVNKTRVAEASSSQWSVDATQFADNMTVIAKVYDGEVPAFDGAYTIVALCGEECRGIGKYVEDKVFITIHGTPGDNIIFKAQENATGNVIDIAQTITFSEQPVGTIDNPYILRLIDATGMDEVATFELTIYPNPVRDVMFIGGDISTVKNVNIISTSGAILRSAEQFDNGINISSLPNGVYIAALVTSKGIVYRKFRKIMH